ncbi:MAG: class A beta-lactamase-related serine hydrolase [Armatimonadota bacterium]|nr:class A beta-lactamase-related serine hydrolase [Armatimonadota bacterium]
MELAIEEYVARIAAGCGGTVSVAVRNVENAGNISINENEVISSASIIKVPMLVEALRQARDGELDLDQEVALSDDQRVRGSGVLRYLHSGIKLTLLDLLWLMIIVSDNTATNIVMDLIGIENVNKTLRSMGYTQTTLRRKMYDWDAIERGLDNVCTAAEMADLLVRIARREAVGGEWDEKALDMLSHQQETSRLGLFLPGEAKLANKTGSREGIFHDCGIVTGPGFRYTIAVFTRDARSTGDAHLTISRISKAVYDHFAARITT